MEIEEFSRVEDLIAVTKETINNIESHVVVKEKTADKSNKQVLILQGLAVQIVHGSI